MKFFPNIPYERSSASLHHHPEISEVTGRKIDWLNETAKSGYEASAVFGSNTIEVKGLPMGKTPQYMEERMRRFFSKFGPVTACSAVGHPLDPYQCEGTAFVTFRESESVPSALQSVLRFGSRCMGYRSVSLRALCTDEAKDGKESIRRVYDELNNIVCGLRGFHGEISTNGVSIEKVQIPNWTFSKYSTSENFFDLIKSLFIVSDNKVFPRKLVNLEAELTLVRAELEKSVRDEFLCINWRQNAPISKLPEYTQRRIRLWDRKDKLPSELQMLSRDFRQHKVHDEKFIVKERKRRERIRTKREGRTALVE